MPYFWLLRRIEGSRSTSLAPAVPVARQTKRSSARREAVPAPASGRWGQLVMSLRANRQNANAVNTTAYATAENAPRVMLSQRIGSTKAPVQANA